MQNTKSLCLIFSILVISACSSLKFPGVYRIAIQQGNYIEQEMVDKLKEGQTKRQVKFILGTPMIEDTFNQDRWDYYYDVKRGEKHIDTKHFIVHFEEGILTRWEGDYKLSAEQLKKEQQEALDKTKQREDAKF